MSAVQDSDVCNCPSGPTDNRCESHLHFVQVEHEQIITTQISAHHDSFAAYTTGKKCTVLIGTLGYRDKPSDVWPEIIPSLQNRNVISIILGYSHFGALTGDGKLLTWGDYSRGALGLGDPLTIEVGKPGGYATSEDKNRAAALSQPDRPEPPRVTVPTEVRFNQGNSNGDQQNMFCIAAAGNWIQTGVLAINLDAIVS